MKRLQDESSRLASELASYRSRAGAKVAALAASGALDAAAKRELEELQLLLEAALGQVDVLARQAALSDLLQHRLARQEDALAALQAELEAADDARAAEVAATLASIGQLEEALALAQASVDEATRCGALQGGAGAVVVVVSVCSWLAARQRANTPITTRPNNQPNPTTPQQRTSTPRHTQRRRARGREVCAGAPPEGGRLGARRRR